MSQNYTVAPYEVMFNTKNILTETRDELQKKYRAQAGFLMRKDGKAISDVAQVWYHFRKRFPNKEHLHNNDEFVIQRADDFDESICELETLDPILHEFADLPSLPKYLFFVALVSVDAPEIVFVVKSDIQRTVLYNFHQKTLKKGTPIVLYALRDQDAST